MSADLVSLAREVYGPRPPECAHCHVALRATLGGFRDGAGSVHCPDGMTVHHAVAVSPPPPVIARSQTLGWVRP